MTTSSDGITDVPEDDELLAALKQNKGALDGSEIAAPHVAAISEQILQEASVRSQELQHPMESNRLAAQERGTPVPWWLIILLVVAVAVFAAALFFAN
jgi:hypothetical protein